MKARMASTRPLLGTPAVHAAALMIASCNCADVVLSVPVLEML